MAGNTDSRLASVLSSDRPLSLSQRLNLVLSLSWPAVLAQLSSIIMEYIDASMVGSLGASASASIGLVTTTTWLFWGMGGALSTGFSVQVAHLIGARRQDSARDVFVQSIIALSTLGILLALIGIAISGSLPVWLGGNKTITPGATSYFTVVTASMPFCYLTFLCSSMLRCAGNMLVPGILNVVMCVLDVCFNYFLIFDSHTVCGITFPGFGLGVQGAAIGTALAEIVTGAFMLWFIIRHSVSLNFRSYKWRWHIDSATLRRALHISLPIASERILMSGAQIITTIIVAPLGTAAIAANSFALTAEGLCYMPGYGVSDAATTLVGQSLGAKRHNLARGFGNVTITLGIAIMSVMGLVLWFASPIMMSLFTPDQTVRLMGVEALRIESFAEPMFAASIVTYGVMVGAGYTVVPACINLASIWIVRLSLAAVLAPIMGLNGVWLAMSIELCVRGLVFLWAYFKTNWIKKANIMPDTEIDEIEQNPKPYVL